jgi:RHS repeat-associated protein
LSIETGFSAQSPSLPSGGGAVGGLGETYTPDLSTGTGTFSIPLDLPNGPNDIGPSLALRYDTGSGNGPFGMGFSLPLPRLLRSTAHGFPGYTASDPLALEGAGPVLRMEDGSYRLQVDAGAWQVEACGEGFRLIDRRGLYYFLGTTPGGRLFPFDRPQEVCAWHLERIEDALGNAVDFVWQRDGDQLYLARIGYSLYEIVFRYAARPDVLRHARAGFLIRTALRCEGIELRLPSDAEPLLRSWRLEYATAANGCSLLAHVTLTGFDQSGQPLDSPPLHLSYTRGQTRTLQRFKDQEGSQAPGPLGSERARIELVDWDGSGLPDLLAIESGGSAHVWPNRGDCVWGRPRPVGWLPLFASPSAALGLADLNGDGCADLLRMDRLLSGYLPRSFAGGFDEPVAWSRAPSISPAASNARLTDLDGDGMVDLLASAPEGGLELFYRHDPEGWEESPQRLLPGEAPEVRLDDPHVFLADMTGDGSPDIVHVLGGQVTYWPYLGRGRWGEAIRMDAAPVLPFDVRPGRVLLADIDGDGCADLLYLDRDRVRYWLNQSGCRFGPEQIIDYVPTAQIERFRLADMTGAGTTGLFWYAPSPFGRSAAYFYLDFFGGEKPYLLCAIDNGVGRLTRIEYSTSAREAANDTVAGQPWRCALPVVVPVVARLAHRDQASGVVGTVRYHYHDGRFDGPLREFCGFGRVEEEQSGDEAIAALRTVSWFHNGLDFEAPGGPCEPATLDRRRRLRALRGRLLRQERYGLDGSPQEPYPYDRRETEWQVLVEGDAGHPVYVPRQLSSINTIFERRPTPAAIIVSRNLGWDTYGNPTEALETAETPGDPTSMRTLRTLRQYAHDSTRRFLSLVKRVQQFDGSGLRVADTLTAYDGLEGSEEGEIGAQGLVTRRSSLALTDELAAQVYGTEQPDWGTLGYYRRPGETGWWVDEARYQRSDGPAGLRGTVLNALGAASQVIFDESKIYPASMIDPYGNTVTADYDYRTCRVRRLVDAAGAEYQARCDALARPLSQVTPGDSPALPSVEYAYRTDVLPIQAITRQRAECGRPEAIEQREFYDGAGRSLEIRRLDETSEIVSERREYCTRGLVRRGYLAYRPSSQEFVPPPDGTPFVALRYDALGRMVEQTNPDGSARRLVYGSLCLDVWDEEDDNGPHAGTPTRKRFDPTGRLASIEERLGGTVLTSTYEYDIKGRLVRHVDAQGGVVRIEYDLLGRTLRVERPESGCVTVYDAAGNPVEARSRGGRRVYRQYDACGRPATVRRGSPQAEAEPQVRYTYHDAGQPAPPDAGLHTRGGLCVRIDDESGITTFDYDERGRLSYKRSQPAGQSQVFELAFRYRADGQLAEVVYPETGHGRPVVRYEYNRRGLPVRIPGIISQIEYDESGRPVRRRYANGVEEYWSYNALTGRLKGMDLNGSDGVIRSVGLSFDRVGNLLKIDSPDPTVALACSYDNLYRLTTAQAGDGHAWNYQYDGVGNLTFKSDVGELRYGENGLPAALLSSAGGQPLSYTSDGEIASAPWGSHSFDGLGRLASVTSPSGERSATFTYDFSGRQAAVRTLSGGSAVREQLSPDPRYSLVDGRLVLYVVEGGVIVACLGEAGAVYVHTDHLGSPAVVTGIAGEVLARLRYDPYGGVLDGAQMAAGLPQSYTGGLLESSSGLVCLGARYYHPIIGRFISPDAVVARQQIPVDWSPYVYAAGNPLRFVDPTGQGFWEFLLGAIGIVALLVVALAFPPAWVTAPVIAAVVGGMVAGGVVGGIAAYKAGGDPSDILSGIFLGAAVGGWAAYAACAAATLLPKTVFGSELWSNVIQGAVRGGVNGMGTGLATAWAGVKGSFEEVLQQMFWGLVVGVGIGAVLGAWTPSDKSMTAEQAYNKFKDPMGLPKDWTKVPEFLDAWATAPQRAMQGLTELGLSQVQPYLITTAGQTLVADSMAGSWNLDFQRKIIKDVVLALYLGMVLLPAVSDLLVAGYLKYLESKT